MHSVAHVCPPARTTTSKTFPFPTSFHPPLRDGYCTTVTLLFCRSSLSVAFSLRPFCMILVYQNCEAAENICMSFPIFRNVALIWKVSFCRSTMMSTYNSAAVDGPEEVIDLTHPQTSQSEDQRVSSFPSAVRTPLLTSSFQDRSQFTSVMDVKETKWPPKTSVIGIMRGSAYIMYYVCSRMMAKSL